MFEGIDITQMLNAYVTCALWSRTHTPDDVDNVVDMDSLVTPDEFADETLETMRADCERFIALPDVLAACGPLDDTRGAWSLFEQIGHDLWLTRNGHGTGFWDRLDREGFSKAYRDLANLVGWRTDFPEQNLYIGDDGKVYIT